jgi:3-deoxy-D-manno-octulosonate 8-phosphate phosphatase (KDO 8-P phosphatase)
MPSVRRVARENPTKRWQDVNPLPEKPLTVRQKAARIRLLALDVDGTLTDGKLYFGPQGEAMKAFSVLDGQGLALLKNMGMRLALITGRNSEILHARASELKIDIILQGVKDKGQALLQLARDFALEPCEIAMMGDDWPDLAAFKFAGLSAAPGDAHAEVRERADWVSRAAAGAGAARELCDYLLKAQGQYQKALAKFLEVPVVRGSSTGSKAGTTAKNLGKSK